MTPARLRQCLTLLGWSARHLARQIDRDHKVVWHWLEGSSSIPWQVAAWLEERAGHAERTPPPGDLLTRPRRAG